MKWRFRYFGFSPTVLPLELNVIEIYEEIFITRNFYNILRSFAIESELYSDRPEVFKRVREENNASLMWIPRNSGVEITKKVDNLIKKTLPLDRP